MQHYFRASSYTHSSVCNPFVMKKRQKNKRSSVDICTSLMQLDAFGRPTFTCNNAVLKGIIAREVLHVGCVKFHLMSFCETSDGYLLQKKSKNWEKRNGFDIANTSSLLRNLFPAAWNRSPRGRLGCLWGQNLKPRDNPKQRGIICLLHLVHLYEVGALYHYS